MVSTTTKGKSDSFFSESVNTNITQQQHNTIKYNTLSSNMLPSDPVSSFSVCYSWQQQPRISIRKRLICLNLCISFLSVKCCACCALNNNEITQRFLFKVNVKIFLVAFYSFLQHSISHTPTVNHGDRRRSGDKRVHFPLRYLDTSIRV